MSARGVRAFWGGPMVPRPGAVRTLNTRSLSPLVLTCEHASRELPRGLRPRNRVERGILSSHWGWDIGAWSLTRRLARRLDAGAVGGGWSRLVVDLNRRIGDPTLVRCHAEGRSEARRVGQEGRAAR